MISAHLNFIIVFNNEKTTKLSIASDGEVHWQTLGSWLSFLQWDVQQILKQGPSSSQLNPHSSRN
jgi:hypothetical protein